MGGFTRDPGSLKLNEVTRIMRLIEQGDGQANQDLLPLVYDELRRIANWQMAAERTEHTLQPTALVHEAWLRLVDDEARQWDSRAHFFSAAAEAMRRILVEHARRKCRQKHGGNHQRVPLNASRIAGPVSAEQLIALSEAWSNWNRITQQPPN